ncbi:MAG: transcription antitermination factor NusB [Bacillota bacterium]|nr:transcription antitermination factor NusB [Bacillota bacterium]
MKRTTAREIAVQLGFFASASERPVSEIIEEFFDEEYYATLAAEDELFAEFPDDKQKAYIVRLTNLVEDYRIQIDKYIEKYSTGWKVSRISKTAIAVLRCAICEILYMDDIPNSAAINEAVELSKGYDEPETVAFINGVLGGFMRGEFAECGELPEKE